LKKRTEKLLRIRTRLFQDRGLIFKKQKSSARTLATMFNAAAFTGA
jgi:hypothetical protein